MHHARRAAVGQHRLVAGRQRQVHGKEAVFLMLDCRHGDPPVRQPAVEPVAQEVEGDGRTGSQRRLFHEVAALAQIHCIEKGGRQRQLIVAQMAGAIVHEHELIRVHRRGGELTHQAVGHLLGDRSLRRALHQRRPIPAGVDHDARADRCGGGRHRGGSGGVGDAGGRALPPGHVPAGAALQQMRLEPRIVEQPILAAQVVALSPRVDDTVRPARAEEMGQSQAVDFVAPDAVGIGPGGIRRLGRQPAHAQPGVGQRRSQRHPRRAGPDDEYVVHVCNQGR